MLGWRRRATLIEPLSRRLSFGRENRLLIRMLGKIDRVFNRFLSDRYAHSLKQQQLHRTAAPHLTVQPSTPISENAQPCIGDHSLL
jgi:hypothetical protein